MTQTNKVSNHYFYLVIDNILNNCSLGSQQATDYTLIMLNFKTNKIFLWSVGYPCPHLGIV